MSLFNFLSDVCDAIPIVGHVKGVIHDIAGDDEGARRAYMSATRTTLVVGGGAVGSLLGPVGAAAAAAYTGALTDTVTSMVTNEPVGIVRNVVRLGAARDLGDVIVGVGRMGLDIGLDATTGVSIGAATKSIAQGSTKQLLKSGSKEAARLAGQRQVVKHSAVGLGTQVLSQRGRDEDSFRCSSSSSTSSNITWSSSSSPPDNDPSTDLSNVSEYVSSSSDEDEEKTFHDDAQLEGYIYAFIDSDGNIKVGMTRRPILDRLNEYRRNGRIKPNSYIAVYKLRGHVRWAETTILNDGKIKAARKISEKSSRLTETLNISEIGWQDVIGVIERVVGQTGMYVRTEWYYYFGDIDTIYQVSPP